MSKRERERERERERRKRYRRKVITKTDNMAEVKTWLSILLYTMTK